MAASHRGVITGHGSPIYSTRTLRRGHPNLPDDIPLPQSPGVAPDTLGYQVTSPSPPRSTNERERARRGPETDGPSSLPPLESGVSAPTHACKLHTEVSSVHTRVSPALPRRLRRRVNAPGSHDRSATRDSVSAHFRGDADATLFTSVPTQSGDALPGGSGVSRGGRRSWDTRLLASSPLVVVF